MKSNSSFSIADTRTAQANRVAYFLQCHPGSTQKEIDAECDTGCISKVLSVMSAMGYHIAKGWRRPDCVGVGRRRRVRTYWLVHRTDAVGGSDGGGALEQSENEQHHSNTIAGI